MAVTVSVPSFLKRHGHASHAVMNGVPVPVFSRFLGQRQSRSAVRRQQSHSVQARDLHGAAGFVLLACLRCG